VKLKSGEKLIINEGKTGWGTTLALTNKRLLILDQEKIIGETPLENISGAYAETQALANLTQLKIKLKDGKEMTIIFRSSVNGRLYAGSASSNTDIIDLTNRYVEAINRAVSEKLAAVEV
jgi:predicted DNA-binding antitoxin AbrB/MazE fold protein